MNNVTAMYAMNDSGPRMVRALEYKNGMNVLG